MLYNNPFYPISLILPLFIFPLFNTFVLVTFTCMMIYLSIILSASFVEREKQKRFMFYLPKVILIGAIWILYSIVFIYYQLREKDDPSYDAFANSGNIFMYIGLFSLILFLFFLFVIFYYQFRAVGFFFRGQLPENLAFKVFLTIL